MTTILNINVEDLSAQFVNELKRRFGKSAKLEIKVQDSEAGKAFLSEEEFWKIIDSLDWSKKNRDEVVAPAVQKLAAMPVAAIYLFADILSEKLWMLDTKAHAAVFTANEGNLSVDDFLYARCGVVAEGKEYFENVQNSPSEMPPDLTFEPLLHLAHDAYQLKTGKKLIYKPEYNYETYSNKQAWQ